MKNEETKLQAEQAEKIRRIFDRALLTLDAKWPDSACDHLAEVRSIFIGRLMNSARIVALRRLQETNTPVPEGGLVIPGELTVLERLRLKYGQTTEIGSKPDGEIQANATSPRPVPVTDPVRPDSSEAMIADWKDELCDELVEMDEDLTKVFTALDELAFLDADQICAVRVAADTELGIDFDDDDFSYEGVDIPDDALGALMDFSGLTDAQKDLLHEYDRGMFTWLQYQLCQEILLGE
jgi:hypothetical protein